MAAVPRLVVSLFLLILVNEVTLTKQTVPADKISPLNKSKISLVNKIKPVNKISPPNKIKPANKIASANVSGRAGPGYPVWEYFNCNEKNSRPRMSELNQTDLLMMVWEQRLHFFYRGYVIRLSVVERSENFGYLELWRRCVDNQDKDDPESDKIDKIMTHAELEAYRVPDHQDANRITYKLAAPKQAREILGWADMLETDKSEEYKSYEQKTVMVLDGEDPKIDMFNTVDMEQSKSYGVKTKSVFSKGFKLNAGDYFRDSKGNSVNKDPDYVRPIYVRKDAIKQIRFQYWAHSLRITYSARNGTVLAQATRYLNYRVKQMVYYEASLFGYAQRVRKPKKQDPYQPWAVFAPMVVELDTEFMLHFTRYVIEIRRFQKWMRVLATITHEMTVNEFFSCMDRGTFMTRHPSEVKGIIFQVERFSNGTVDTAQTRTLLFFDYFYIIAKLDLVANEFVFNVPGLKKEFKRYPGNWAGKTKIDRLSSKFLKHLLDDKGYPVVHFSAAGPGFYWNRDRKWLAQEVNVGSDNQLRFSPTESFSITCPMNTLVIGDLGYCFDRWTYRCWTVDNFKTLLTPETEMSRKTYHISDIFRPTKFQWEYEGLELIFEYSEKNVVFMTKNWLYVLNRSALKTIHDWRIIFDGSDEKMFVKKHNCLWSNCVKHEVNEPMDSDGEELDDRRKRQAVSPETGDNLADKADKATDWTKDDPIKSTNAEFVNDVFAKILTASD